MTLGSDQARERDVGIVLMVEPGRYEWQGVLLISSLLGFAYDDIGIWAYCREELLDDLHPATLSFFVRHGIALEGICPEYEVIYPQGNKLYACAAERTARATVLLDTDMMLVQPTRFREAITPGCVSGRATSGWMWGKSVEEWALAYRSLGLDTPRYRLARAGGSFVAASLAAAFVAYEEPGFGAVWRDTALEIERARLAQKIYPTLDQISLPVAIERAGLRPRMVTASWNKGGVLRPGHLHKIFVHHYQRPEKLLATANKWIADALLRDFADFASVEDLIAFYDREGAKPEVVDGNDGYWEAVRAAQNKRRGRHEPGVPGASPDDEE